MLCEIICDYFKQPRIQFYPGLNTVLGDGSGSNSIGKSTFLMIIDFVFGGNDYVNKSTDVQRNIGRKNYSRLSVKHRSYPLFPKLEPDNTRKTPNNWKSCKPKNLN